MLTKDEFVMELCGNKAAWQIVPENLDKIDLAVVGARIVEAGYEIGVSTRFCVGPFLGLLTSPCSHPEN